MSEYDFALQWLDYLGTSIYNHKGERLFEYKGMPKYEISPLDTKLELNEDLGEEDDKEEYSTMPFKELEYYHFCIGTSHVRWKNRQRVCYYIKQKISNSKSISLEAFRKITQLYGVHIQHDPKNCRVRLVGESVLPAKGLNLDSGVGPWMSYSRLSSQRGKKRKKFKLDREAAFSILRGDYDEEDDFTEIHEIPLIRTPEGYYVCMEKKTVTQKMIVVGGTGKGKSLLVNAVATRIFYIWCDRMGWLIDPLNQLYNLSAPQDYEPFNKINYLLNNEPRPIPAVQLYLACKNKFEIAHPNISIIMTLGFLEFLNKYKFYVYGIKEFDVGDTIRYLQDYISELRHITSAKELDNIMMANIPGATDKKNKNIRNMIYKWTNTFETIFKEKFTSNLYRDNYLATHEIRVRFEDGTIIKGNPFIMLMEAGVIPVLNTSAARRCRWIRNLLADLMQKIVHHQMARPKGQQHRMWVIADELNDIYEMKSGKRMDNCAIAFEELFRQGRFNNIGFIGNTQSLSKLNEEMYANASHIVCCHLQKTKDRKLVGESFNLSKEEYNQIGMLKPLEAMVLSREGFVVYDKFGRRKVVDNRVWFKGKILPPMNFHNLPKGG